MTRSFFLLRNPARVDEYRSLIGLMSQAPPGLWDWFVSNLQSCIVMIYEDVNEIIEVITVFRQGRMRPLKFRWKERVYQVSRINGGWVSDEGCNKHYHYSVSTGGPDCFELCFDVGGMQWELTRVFMDG